MKYISLFAFVLVFTSYGLINTELTCSGQLTNGVPASAFGSLTNGIRGEIAVAPMQSSSNVLEIQISVNNVATSNMPLPGVATMEELLERCDYFMATNSFCGPVELRDNAGMIVPSIKPKVSVYPGREILYAPDMSSQTAYPLSYSLMNENANYFSQFMVYSGPHVFPLPVFLYAFRTELARFELRRGSATNDVINPPNLYQPVFQLSDYFDLKSPGDYQLTVWPKIYHRSSTNRDIVVRMDIPPVTSTIKWPGQQPK
jgi:hypothetical protein